MKFFNLKILLINDSHKSNFSIFSVLNRYIPFAMKTILKVYIFSLLTISSCTEESCKTCTSMTSLDGVVQDELNWTAEYCNEELESIET